MQGTQAAHDAPKNAGISNVDTVQSSSEIGLSFLERDAIITENLNLFRQAIEALLRSLTR